MKTLIRWVVFLLLLAGTAGPAAGDIYVWEDADGTLHFTNEEAVAKRQSARKFIQEPTGRFRSAPDPAEPPERSEADDAEPDSSVAVEEAPEDVEPVAADEAYSPPGPNPEAPYEDAVGSVEETVSPEVEEVEIQEEEEIFTPDGESPSGYFRPDGEWDRPGFGDRFANRFPSFHAAGALSGPFYSGPSPYRAVRRRNPNDRYLPALRRTRTVTYRREFRPGTGAPFVRRTWRSERVPSGSDPFAR